MKIAIPSSDKNKVAEHFGRAEYLSIYDTVLQTYKHIDNSENLNALQGAGIQSATMLINEGVDEIVSPSIGPKAFDVFLEANLPMFLISEKNLTLDEVVKKHLAGEIPKMNSSKQKK